MGKHSWVMYVLLIILAGVLLKNAAGSVAILLAGGSEAKGLVNALEGAGAKNTSKGSFAFGGTKFSLG